MNFSPDDEITRFICSRSHFAPRTEKVNFRAFMPPKDKENPDLYTAELSVCLTSGLSNYEVWKLGIENVQSAARSLSARADLSVAAVSKAGLKVVHDPQPYERHANLTPFPSDKLACQSIATKLALASQLVVIPEV